MTEEQWTKVLAILQQRNLEKIFQQHRQLFEQRLAELGRAYASSLPAGELHRLPASATVADVLAEHARNAHRVDTLFQALAFSISPEMLAMMWMVMLGATVEKLEYGYRRKSQMHLEVEIELPDRVTRRVFRSSEHWDSAVLKMMALSQSDGLPMVEDFHALQVPAAANA